MQAPRKGQAYSTLFEIPFLYASIKILHEFLILAYFMCPSLLKYSFFILSLSLVAVIFIAGAVRPVVTVARNHYVLFTSESAE
jgi:hypothetical protein